MKNKNKKITIDTIVTTTILILLIVVIWFFLGNMNLNDQKDSENSKNNQNSESESYNLDNIPEYTGDAYIELYGGTPNFSDEDYQSLSFEFYSELDELGRVGKAFAKIGIELMPTEARKGISNIYPSGWVQAKYDTNIVSGGYLYNRCHLIGYQLTGENANKKNLMTCTKSMNVSGMLPHENKVANYIKNTNNHVLYRVTPIFDGDNLLANGVQIEASSVEDKCGKICFNFYVYNAQKGITIDYSSGESQLLAN